MTEKEVFDFIIEACVPPRFWDTINGKPNCWYGFHHDGEGYWLDKVSSGIAFGPFETLERATKELRRVIAERIDGVLKEGSATHV